MSHMRNLLLSRHVRLGVAAFMCSVLWSAAVFAQSKPASKPAAVAGTYEGWIRGSSQGDAATTVTLTQNGATLAGTMDAGPYHFTIDGSVDGDNLSWNFSSSDVTGSVTGTYKAGAINGSWSAMGSESGTLELKRAQAK